MNDPGWTKQSKTNRYTANLNMSYKILPELTLNLISWLPAVRNVRREL